MTKFAPYAFMHRAARALCFVALAALPSGCSEEAAPPSMDDLRAEVEPTQEGWGVRFVISEAASRTDESRPRVEIQADYMATFETPDSTYTVMQGGTTGRRILAHFFDEAGDTSATLRANRLILHEKQRRFDALEDVVVTTRDDKSLESEHLVWLEDDRRIRTPGFVRITTPSERIQGYNLVADEDLETYTLARVTGQVTIEDEEGDSGEVGEKGEERGEESEEGAGEEEGEESEEGVGEEGGERSGSAGGAGNDR